MRAAVPSGLRSEELATSDEGRRDLKSAPEASGASRACPRILVVEDDPEAALFAVHVLANRGQFAVVHTADPAEALRLAADEHWDLLLTDLDLPGMTGLELLAALRQVAPGLPVAMTSAHAMDATLPSLLGHADEYLEKPLRVDKLIATVTALIGQGRRPVTDAGL
jgi:CheY-like chemotaxis protein